MEYGKIAISFFVVSNGRNVVPSTIWGILTTKTDYLTLLVFLSLHPASHGKRGRCVILRYIKYAQMFLHHFICSVHFSTVQKHTGFETIPHLYWKNDKGVKPANGFQPAFSGHSVISEQRDRGFEGWVVPMAATTARVAAWPLLSMKIRSSLANSSSVKLAVPCSNSLMKLSALCFDLSFSDIEIFFFNTFTSAHMLAVVSFGVDGSGL